MIIMKIDPYDGKPLIEIAVSSYLDAERLARFISSYDELLENNEGLEDQEEQCRNAGLVT